MLLLGVFRGERAPPPSCSIAAVRSPADRHAGAAVRARPRAATGLRGTLHRRPPRRDFMKAAGADRLGGLDPDVARFYRARKASRASSFRC